MWTASCVGFHNQRRIWRDIGGPAKIEGEGMLPCKRRTPKEGLIAAHLSCRNGAKVSRYREMSWDISALGVYGEVVGIGNIK